MENNNPYEVGDVARLVIETFERVAVGEPPRVDPVTVRYRIREPGGIAGASQDAVRVSIGLYQANIPITKSGLTMVIIKTTSPDGTEYIPLRAVENLEAT